ncbi:A24 family peptidase [Pelagibacterium xiamenense]|uniref:A24 family peptidase n=1 Tax=Pelagibacterium xiamenense TaxID=2901140 RepID=UPI001E49EBC3|nr:prepilin peptidase [Pelagibacterium xiamenense]MCD7058869.1 prepilin peptidase [Pelagibacterium xiamenense]
MTFVATFVFPAFMLAAAISDLLTMRIPNWMVLALAAAFPVIGLAIGLPLETMLVHCLVATGFLVVAFGMFAAGWIGGGDAKLSAATALWLGLGAWLPYLLYSAVAGGVLTITMLILRRFALPPSLAGVPWVARLHDRVTGIPYGIALAIGGLLAYPQSAVFLLLAS